MIGFLILTHTKKCNRISTNKTIHGEGVWNLERHFYFFHLNLLKKKKLVGLIRIGFVKKPADFHRF